MITSIIVIVIACVIIVGGMGHNYCRETHPFFALTHSGYASIIVIITRYGSIPYIGIAQGVSLFYHTGVYVIENLATRLRGARLTNACAIVTPLKMNYS